MAMGGSSGGKAGGIRAGKAFVETALDMAGLKGGLLQAKRLVMGASKGFGIAGASLLGLGTGLLGAVAAPFREVVDHFDEIQKAADRLGTSTESLSALGYAAEQSGSNLEELESAAKIMQKNLINSPEAFDKLGMSAAELAKMPLAEQIEAISDAIAELDSHSKTAASLAIFGKAGTRLLPLFKDGAEGIRALKKEAEDVGAVVGGDNARKAERAGDAISRAWTAVKNTIRAVGAAILPEIDTLERLTGYVVSGAKIVREFIGENRQLILIIAGVGAGLAAAGAAFIGIGTSLAVAGVALGGIITGITAVGTIISTIWAWLPAIAIVAGIAAAVGGLGYALYKFTVVGDYARDLFRGLGEVIGWASGILTTAWEGISAALEAGDLNGAMDVAKQTLSVFWAALKYGAQVAWSFVKEKALNAWDDVIGFGKKALVDVDAELKIFGTDMEDYLKETFESIWKFFKNGWKDSFNAFLDMSNAALEAEARGRQYVKDHWKDIAAGAIGASGLGLIIGGGKEGVDAATKPIGEGQALAEQLGDREAAKKRIRLERDRLKAAEDALTQDKKDARAAREKEKIDKALEELKQEERKLEAEKQKQELAARDKRIAANTAIFAALMKDINGMGQRKQDAIAGISAATRSAFGTFGNSALMFGGGGGVLNKIEKNTADAAEDLDDIKNKGGLRH